MDDAVYAVPVRYMVISGLYGMVYQVIDTSFVGQGRTVAKSKNIDDAYMVCNALNEVYGHPQGSEQECSNKIIC